MLESVSILTRRNINIAGFLFCAGLMAYALYSQHIGGLNPCPLCVFQRVAVIGMGILFLMAALHDPQTAFARVYAVGLLVVASFGGIVAARHIYLQNLPTDQVPVCGPGLDYLLDAFPLSEALQLVFQGSGECAEVQWSFLGLSMPGWVLVWFVALGLGGFYVNWRRGAWPSKRAITSL